MKIAIAIPVFNHAATITRVITDVQTVLTGAGEDLPILVINDGSTDGTRDQLATRTDITLLNHPRNRGKGAALATGFTHAAAEKFTHVITVDADGQHHPPDILTVLAAARAHPEDLIIGQRDMDTPGDHPVPARSKKGRDAARFWLRVQTAQDIPDTQCGLRAYPLAAALAVPRRFRRYDFETEILARLAWAGVKIRSVPVKCIYFPGPQRVSHFRPIIDTLRGVRVNVFLVARRLLPLPFRRLVSAPTQEGTVKFGRWWKWSTWRDAIAESLRAGASNAELAMAFSMGIFVGLTPFYMLQTLLAIYFARRLHLNVLAAVIGSQISIPPLMPVWAGLSYAVGHLLLTGNWVLSDMNQLRSHWTWDFSKLASLVIGSMPVALVVSIVGLFIARALLYFFRTQRLPAKP